MSAERQVLDELLEEGVAQECKLVVRECLRELALAYVALEASRRSPARSPAPSASHRVDGEAGAAGVATISLSDESEDCPVELTDLMYGHAKGMLSEIADAHGVARRLAGALTHAQMEAQGSRLLSVVEGERGDVALSPALTGAASTAATLLLDEVACLGAAQVAAEVLRIEMSRTLYDRALARALVTLWVRETGTTLPVNARDALFAHALERALAGLLEGPS